MKPIIIRGARSLRDIRYIHLSDGKNQIWEPLEGFADNGIFRRLAASGIVILTRRSRDAVLEEIAALTDFPVQNILDRPGWTRGIFALPDHTVFAPKGEPAVCVFPPVANKCCQRGSLKKWLCNVATELKGQRLPIFMLCISFVAPLLKLVERSGNFGFEIVGSKGIGKSTLQYLASSALGCPVQGEDGPYWITFHTTLNALEVEMRAHSDMPMFIEEGGLFFAGEAPAKRARAFKELAFKLSAGNDKARLGSPVPQDSRFCYVSSSNEPLAELIGQDTEVARAAADRLMTITVPPDSPHGVFDSVPEGVGSASEYASMVMRAAARQYGTAFQQFISKLVEARCADERGLRQDLASLIEEFQTELCSDRNDGSVVRVTEAFAIVYAAGRLAQRLGALPNDLEIGKAVQHALRLHQLALPARRPFAERLSALAADARTLVVEDPSTARKKAVKAAVAVLRIKRKGSEILVIAARVKKAFPEWKALSRQPDCRALLKYEGGRLTVKRRLWPGGPPIRVYCFRWNGSNSK